MAKPIDPNTRDVGFLEIETALVNSALRAFECHPSFSARCIVKMAGLIAGHSDLETRTAVALEMVAVARQLDPDVLGAGALN